MHAGQNLKSSPSDLNNITVLCVVETAMGTPVHAQEDLESTYVSAVYEWVDNMCQQMLAQFGQSENNIYFPQIFPEEKRHLPTLLSKHN
jgi:hypothetical protein